MVQNGQPSAAPGPLGLFSPWMYAIRWGVHRRWKASCVPTPICCSGSLVMLGSIFSPAGRGSGEGRPRLGPPLVPTVASHLCVALHHVQQLRQGLGLGDAVLL